MKKSILMGLLLTVVITVLISLAILPASALSVVEWEYEEETTCEEVCVEIEASESEIYRTFNKLCTNATDIIYAKHLEKNKEKYYNEEFGGYMEKATHSFEITEVSMGTLSVGDKLEIEIELSIFSTIGYGYHELDNLPYHDGETYILILHRSSPSSTPSLIHKTLVIPSVSPSEGVLYGSSLYRHLSSSLSVISDPAQFVDYVIDVAQGEIVIDDRVVVNGEVYLEEEDGAMIQQILSRQNWSSGECLVDNFQYGLVYGQISWLYSVPSYLVREGYTHGALSYADTVAFETILKKYFDDEELGKVETEKFPGPEEPAELPFGSLEQNGIYMPPLEVVDKVVIETAYGVDYPVMDNELIEKLYSAITGSKFRFSGIRQKPLSYEHKISFYVGENRYSFCLHFKEYGLCAFILDPSEYGRYVVFEIQDREVGKTIYDLCADYCYANSPKKPLVDCGIFPPLIDDVRYVELAYNNQDTWVEDKEFIENVLSILYKMEISYYGSNKSVSLQGYRILIGKYSSFDDLYIHLNNQLIMFDVTKGTERYEIVFEASEEELQELYEYCEYYWFEVLGLPEVLDTDTWYDEEIWETCGDPPVDPPNDSEDEWCDGETGRLVESQIGTDIVSDEDNSDGVNSPDESNTQTCDTSSGGCGSTLVGVAIIPAMLAAGLVLTKKRRK